jgi:hypothetical protein
MIEGDRVFDALSTPPNPACDPETGGNCRAPTIRNTGNIPVTIDVTQDDMDFGQTSGDWNVRWDARLGLENPVMFWPEETAHLHYGEGEGAPLDLCALDKISFSIHVIKAKPNTDHSGFALIEPIPVETCWWMV